MRLGLGQGVGVKDGCRSRKLGTKAVIQGKGSWYWEFEEVRKREQGHIRMVVRLGRAGLACLVCLTQCGEYKWTW